MKRIIITLTLFLLLLTGCSGIVIWTEKSYQELLEIDKMQTEILERHTEILKLQSLRIDNLINEMEDILNRRYIKKEGR